MEEVEEEELGAEHVWAAEDMEQEVVPPWEDPEEVEDNGSLIVAEVLGTVGGILTGILTMYICAHQMQIVD